MFYCNVHLYWHISCLHQSHTTRTHARMHAHTKFTNINTYIYKYILHVYIYIHTHVHICTWTHKLLYSFYSCNKWHTHTHINLHSISITTLYRLSITLHTHTYTQITASLCLLLLDAEHKSKGNLTHFGETCKYLAQRMSLQSQRGSKHWEKRRKRGSKRHREMDINDLLLLLYTYM